MKKILLTLIALVGFTALAEAQIVRPVGVVRKTTRTINAAPVWESEMNRWVHSTGAELGLNFDNIVVGARYRGRYRFSPLCSVGGMFSGAYNGNSYHDMLYEARAEVTLHPLAIVMPYSRAQLFVSEGIGLNSNFYQTGDILGHATSLTTAIGVDLYGHVFNSAFAVEFSYCFDNYPVLVATYLIKF